MSELRILQHNLNCIHSFTLMDENISPAELDNKISHSGDINLCTIQRKGNQVWKSSWWCNISSWYIIICFKFGNEKEPPYRLLLVSDLIAS